MNSRYYTSILLFTIAILLNLTGFCHAQAAVVFTVNGCPAFSDSTAGTVLVSVPQQWFGTSVEATFGNSDSCIVESVDGMPLENDSTFIFNNISGSKSWSVACSNGKVFSLQFTFLPIVALDGYFGYDYTNGSVSLAEPGQPASEMMMARIKWRGGSTNTPEKHKRNYSIKFVDENGEKQNRKLMDMRRDNHWILDAGQIDMARVRNRVATELWLDMAREPYYFDKAPDALSGVRGEVVELFLGNEYRGIYSLTEAMDRKQLQLVKHDTINNVFHGGLWKTDKFTDETGFKWAEEYNDSLPDYYGFTTMYPEIDEVFPTSYEVLYNAVNAMMWSYTYEYFNNVVDQYFDVPVVIDYTIFYLTLCANDNSTKNIYWLCYDREEDPRLSIAVWDLDATMGQSWSPMDWRPPIVAYDFFNQPFTWPFKMMFHNKCKYRQQFLDRYDELRASWLSEQSLVNRYATAIDRLIECGAATREENRWNGDSDLFGHPLNFAQEKQYITEWITNRLPLLDVWMHHHLCDVNFDGVVSSVDITILYNYLINGDDSYNEALDTDFDGVISAADITCIYNELLGF